MSNRSLAGRKILVTRTVEQSREMVEAIEQRGGEACVVPMIAIVDPEDWQPCDKALASLGKYEGVLFTSRNGAENFLKRCKSKAIAFRNVSMYAVGEKTAEVLRQQGIAPEFVPEVFASAALEEYFQTKHVEGKTFLFPKGNISKQDLPRLLRTLGAEVDEVEVYRNVPPPGEMFRDVNERLSGKEFAVVIVASPSAIVNFRTVISPELLHASGTKLAVIGPTTRLAAEEAGFAVDIEPGRSTSDDLIEAIARYFIELQT